MCYKMFVIGRYVKRNRISVSPSVLLLVFPGGYFEICRGDISPH